MKRSCDEMDTNNETDMITEESSTSDSKKLKEATNDQACQLSASDSAYNVLNNVFKQFIGSELGQPQHTFVERNPNPGGYSLVNPEYVGKKSLQDHEMDMDNSIAQASQFVVANMRNRVDQIGLQMKYLHESLQKTFKNSMRDSNLHMAACNFVKKPGNIYHLYERPSGQKYFSMLSPQDWGGNTPHKFLGSWFLEADQSWTPEEERHLKYEGASFLKSLYTSKSIC